MPRVSQEHREQRRQQILEAARRCFIREGFHQTSMADIFAEARLSSGAVYGYFKSKDEIIVEIARQVIGGIAGLLTPIIEQEPPPPLDEVVRQGLRATSEVAFGPEGAARLAPQVWAEALRNPALAEVIEEWYGVIHGMLSRLITAEQKLGRVSPEGDPDQAAKVLIGAIMGYILQRVLVGNVDPDSYASGIATIAPQQA